MTADRRREDVGQGLRWAQGVGGKEGLQPIYLGEEGPVAVLWCEVIDMSPVVLEVVHLGSLEVLCTEDGGLCQSGIEGGRSGVQVGALHL